MPLHENHPHPTLPLKGRAEKLRSRALSLKAGALFSFPFKGKAGMGMVLKIAGGELH
jgi:hypothetical protein